MTTYLLDVNVVLAVVDPAHEFHTRSLRWFERTAQASFATCPIIENGVLRVASSAAYPNRPGDVDVVRSVLAQLCARPGHVFWPDSVSLVDALPGSTGLSSRQVTDIYLALLANRNGGILATFDERIPLSMLGLPAETVARP